jgi:hypothetical protein
MWEIQKKLSFESAMPFLPPHAMQSRKYKHVKKEVVK